jgi:hypothetical protein
MYDAGAADCFDILAVNDYMLWSGPADRRMRPFNINFSRPVYVRDVMVANGDAAKPIWISEMNSNAVPIDPDTDIVDWGAYGQVTPEQQAQYAVRAYQRAMEEWPWIGVVNFWFFKQADDHRRNQAMYYFRLVEPDFTPQPVYEAMRAYTAQLVPTLYPGVHQEDHWALEYAGDWETVRTGSVLQDHRRTATPGATLRFTFEGTSLELVPGPGTGEISVSVDGAQPQHLSLAGEPVRLARGWRSEPHEITLAAISGSVSVDALVVQPPWQPSPWLALCLIALAITTVWAIHRHQR